MCKYIFWFRLLIIFFFGLYNIISMVVGVILLWMLLILKVEVRYKKFLFEKYMYIFVDMLY